MKPRYYILTLLLLFLMSGEGFSSGAGNLADRDCSAGLNLRPSYIMSTHGFYNGWNPYEKPLKSGACADIQFSISDRNRGVYQGVGVAVHTFGAHELTGTPVALYVFQGAPLARVAHNLCVGYEWNLGLSAGWKNNGIVTVSPVNVYINVAALFTWSISSCWEMIFGPEYTHFSNGDTIFPNGGANTVNLRIGARRHFLPLKEQRVEQIFCSDIKNVTFIDRLTYDLVLVGGFRADRSISGGRLYIFNDAFPVASINFNPKYNLNTIFSVGPSIDILYDRSANLIMNENDDGTAIYGYPDAAYQTSLGLSARLELKIPVFAVNIGIGYASHLGTRTRYENRDLNGLYGMFGLKAFLSDRMFLNLSYRLSTVLYSHNLMFGVGWRFGKIISHP